MTETTVIIHASSRQNIKEFVTLNAVMSRDDKTFLRFKTLEEDISEQI